jgi:hypothetical protein
MSSFAVTLIDLCLNARFARGTEIAEENVFPFSAERAEKGKT